MDANEYPSTVGASAALARPPVILLWLRQAVRGRAADPFWARPALLGSGLLAQFRALVASGQVRYLLVGGNGGGPAGPGASDSSISAIDAWAASAGTAVSTGTAAGGTLYDLSGAITSGS